MRKFITGAMLVFLMVATSVVGFSQTTKGFASTYPLAYEGTTTASGEVYASTEFTARHASLPFNTLVKVTNLKNNKSVTVRINDRFNYRNSRVIDVSNAASKAIDLFGDINPQVTIEVVGMADALMLASVQTRVNSTQSNTQTATTSTTSTNNSKPKTQTATVSTTTTTTTTTTTAAADVKKEAPSLLSSIKISIPSISLEDVKNLTTLSIKYLAITLFK